MAFAVSGRKGARGGRWCPGGENYMYVKEQRRNVPSDRLGVGLGFQFSQEITSAACFPKHIDAPSTSNIKDEASGSSPRSTTSSGQAVNWQKLYLGLSKTHTVHPLLYRGCPTCGPQATCGPGWLRVWLNTKL